MEQVVNEHLCRDCGAMAAPINGRCAQCRSRRMVSHPELHLLHLGHIDCDAFYAQVEKRDNPGLHDKPVIVGGGHRGVVSACCYVARVYGVRSAMPMHQALGLCPDAVVLSPDIRRYSAVGREIHAMMLELTPRVERLSIDEAYLDLGNLRAEGRSPAHALAQLVRRIERDVRITSSVGLSYNKLLAKIASDLDKPKGFALVGRGEAMDFLAPRPVSAIWGVGPALARKLEADGIKTVRDLQERDAISLARSYGAFGRRLYMFSRGHDDRTVEPEAPTKSISAETTFDRDLADLPTLLDELRPLVERVARKLAADGLLARTVVLKLKTSDFTLLTRSHRLAVPTQDAGTLWAEAEALLERETDGRAFRLIGAGSADLVDAAQLNGPDLFSTAMPVSTSPAAIPAASPAPPIRLRERDLFGNPVVSRAARRRSPK